MSDLANHVLIDLSRLNVSERTRNLLDAGFAPEAVRHESQRLLNRLQSLVERRDLDGQQLVEFAFSENRPQLVVNDRLTLLERDEQAGLRNLTLGVTRGVRNVFTHDIDRDVSEQDAVIWLGLIGFLHDQLDTAYRPQPTEDRGSEVDASV